MSLTELYLSRVFYFILYNFCRMVGNKDHCIELQKKSIQITEIFLKEQENSLNLKSANESV